MSATEDRKVDELASFGGCTTSKRRERISISGNMLDLFMQMSEGNPGAITALSEVIKADDASSGLVPILNLDDMGMRGAQIWVAYSDHCKKDIKVFMQAIKDRDPAMVATVNACRGCGDVPRAVEYGESYR